MDEAGRLTHSTAPDVVTVAISSKDSSVQMGAACRYLTGAQWPAGYQPTPNPSALNSGPQGTFSSRSGMRRSVHDDADGHCFSTRN